MSRIKKARMPQWRVGVPLVSIEGIDAVMLGRHKHDIMRRSSNGYIGQKEWLCIDKAIDRVRDAFAKLRDIDVARSKKGLIGILAGTQGIALANPALKVASVLCGPCTLA